MSQRKNRSARKRRGQRRQTPHCSEPWPADELSRLLIAARSIPDCDPQDHARQQSRDCRRLAAGCDDIPACEWWPGLLLLSIDTGCQLDEALAIPPTWFDPRRGTVAAGPLVFPLHPLTIEALDTLRKRKRKRLLPWTLDKGQPPFYMLYRAYRSLLYRAGLPHVTANLFDRLKLTADVPGILDALDLSQPFTPRTGEPTLPRAPRPRRAKPKPKAKWRHGQPADPARTLLKFFQEKYLPIKLAGRKQDSASNHLRSIDLFSQYLEREATFDDLQDDTIEDFSAWALDLPRRAATVRSYITCLLAQWRFAWKRRMVDDLPRDVTKPPLESRVPEAWSQQEMVRLLVACGQTPGTIGGIPARLYWPGLVLLMYDTGLRLGPVLKMKSVYLDFETGWLRIPAADQKGRAEQAFRLHSETLDVLAASKPFSRELLLPWPWTNLSKTLYPRFSQILARADLPHTSRDKFHKIRRTSATFVADAAGESEAQKHLGHSSLKLTISHYIDPTKLTRRINAADVIPRPVWQGGAG